MEPHPRAAKRALGLRPLGAPHLVQVSVDRSGMPIAIHYGMPGERARVVRQVEDVWRIVEGWWRLEGPVVRTYYQVAMHGGFLVTLYHDDTCPPAEGWYTHRRLGFQSR